MIIFTPTLFSAGEVLAQDRAGPWEQLGWHSRQVGRAPLEFGSLPEAVEGGEDHAWKQLLNDLPGTSQATSVLSLGLFLHDLCRRSSAAPHLPNFSLPESPRTLPYCRKSSTWTQSQRIAQDTHPLNHSIFN